MVAEDDGLQNGGIRIRDLWSSVITRDKAFESRNFFHALVGGFLADEVFLAVNLE